MTRRFNYTGRQRITSDHFTAKVVSEVPLKATLVLSPTNLRLEPGHQVIIEPYVGTVSKRIECGTVSQLTVPSPYDLSEFQTGGAIQFRVKITGPDGRLVAAGERIRLVGQNEDAGRKPLLPVETDINLGEEIWKVHVNDSTHPKLVLNSHVASLKDRLLSDPVLSGSILLPAVRRVLHVLAEFPGGEIWQPDWLTFVRQFDSDIDPEKEMSEDDRNDWVESIVSEFAERQGFVRRASELLGDASS